MTKNTTGTVLLSAANSYSGTTTVSAGILEGGIPASLPGYNVAGKISVSSGAALGGLIQQGVYPVNGFTEAQFLTMKNDATWAASGAALALDTTNHDYTYVTDITDPVGVSLGVIKMGANILTFNAAKSYSGDTTINAGTLKQGVSGAIPSGVGKGNLVVNSAGTFDLNGLNASINGLNDGLNGGGTVNSSAPGTPILTIGGNNAPGTFSGSINNASGTVSVVKTGTGIQTLAGAGNYSGGTILQSGGLAIGGSSGPLYGVPTSGPVGTGTLTIRGGYMFSTGDAMIRQRLLTNTSSTPPAWTSATLTRLLAGF